MVGDSPSELIYVSSEESKKKLLDLPLSTDDENAAEEEAEVLKLQSEKAKALSIEDYGFEDTGQHVADAEPTLEGKNLKFQKKREHGKHCNILYVLYAFPFGFVGSCHVHEKTFLKCPCVGFNNNILFRI